MTTTLDKTFFQNGKAKQTLKPQRFSMGEIERGLFGWIATLDALETDLMELQYLAHKTKHGRAGASAFWVTWCLSDEHNNRLFDPGNKEDEISDEFAQAFSVVKGWPGSVVRRGFELASARNGLSQNDIEELEKNSETPANGAGNGGKPATPESHAVVG